MRGPYCACIASLLLAACGTNGLDFGPEMAPTPAQQSGITATEQGLIQLAAVDTRGSSVSAAAAGLATSALLLIASDSTGRPALVPSGLLVVDGAAASAPSQVLPGACAVVGDSSIVWHRCLDAGFTIDGTIGWSLGRVTVNVELVGSIQGNGFSYKLSGGMMVSSSSLRGDILVSGTASYRGAQFTQQVGLHVDSAIAQGCLSSGELAVTGSGSGAGAQNGAVLVIWTGCHSFRVRNG
jgi:hypothetical protein